MNTVKLKRSNSALLVINQVRDKIGGNMPGGNNDTMPRGRALKFNSSIIAKMLSPGEKHKDTTTGEIVALTFRGETKKNKVAPPRRKFEVKCYINENGGADMWGELASVGKELHVFTNKDGDPYFKSGNWFFNGEKIANGEAAVTAALKANPELAGEVLTAIRVAMKRGSGLPPVPISQTGTENGSEPQHTQGGQA